MSDDVRGVAVARGDGVAERRGTHESAAAVTFSVMWAIAVLFHIFSGPMRFEAFPEPTALGVNLLALGGVAVAVLVRPRDVRLFVLLGALQLLSVWLETPRLGNHWLVGGFVSLAVLASAASVWWRDRRLDAAKLFRTFAPAARWILLIFYAFAAFAKLNQDFLDPAVSCATFFARESLAVFGLDDLVAGGVSGAVVAGTILVELAVPVLLVLRRTRTVGVVLAVGFHTLLAADLAHPFFDFSSLLLALFVLFLPPGFAGWLGSKVTARGRAGRLLEAGAHVMIVVVAVLLLGAIGPANPDLAVLTLAGAYLLWFAYAAVCVLVVVMHVLLHRPAAESGLFALPSRAMALVPVLVVLNGLTPYLELKTAFGFDMYSNLVTVAGASNHLVIPATLPLTDVQEDLVAIRSSSEPGLQWYADSDYALPWLTFRAYLDDHPDVAVLYVRGGKLHEIRPGDRHGVAPVPVWQEKLMAFRAVDLRSPKRCQDRWGVAN